MAHRFIELGARVKLDPERARHELLEAFRSTSGNMTHTARALGVHPATLKRWVAHFDRIDQSIRSDIAAMRHGEVPRPDDSD